MYVYIYIYREREILTIYIYICIVSIYIYIGPGELGNSRGRDAAVFSSAVCVVDYWCLYIYIYIYIHTYIYIYIHVVYLYIYTYSGLCFIACMCCLLCIVSAHPPSVLGHTCFMQPVDYVSSLRP